MAPSMLEKQEVAHLDDVAFADGNLVQHAVHEVNEQRLLRKIDWHLVPVRRFILFKALV